MVFNLDLPPWSLFAPARARASSGEPQESCLPAADAARAAAGRDPKDPLMCFDVFLAFRNSIELIT